MYRHVNGEHFMNGYNNSKEQLKTSTKHNTSNSWLHLLNFLKNGTEYCMNHCKDAHNRPKDKIPIVIDRFITNVYFSHQSLYRTSSSYSLSLPSIPWSISTT